MNEQHHGTRKSIICSRKHILLFQLSFFLLFFILFIILQILPLLPPILLILMAFFQIDVILGGTGYLNPRFSDFNFTLK